VVFATQWTWLGSSAASFTLDVFCGSFRSHGPEERRLAATFTSNCSRLPSQALKSSRIVGWICSFLVLLRIETGSDVISTIEKR
jgi:hypothetical protein